MDIKQLKYFVVAADVGSFSEAAKVLYTTQSSVSKVILALENELNYPLFERENRGIRLTQEGFKFHAKASRIVADFESLEADSYTSLGRTIKISSNHSSWLANCFSEFYTSYSRENVIFSIHADDTENIINRIRHMEDEVGFIYVFPDTRLQLEYELKKYGLQFEELKSVDGMIFFQPDDDNERIDFNEDMIHDIKYIQSERDEYLKHGSWYTETGKSVDIRNDIGVITNSDYVMHALLKNNALANISAGSFNNFSAGIKTGIKLKNDGGPILFGVVTNKAGKISHEAASFVQYIRDKLN